MIADGAGYNTLASTRYWTGKPLVVDSQGWHRASLATYPLRREAEPHDGLGPEEQVSSLVYDSAKNWDATPIEGASKYASGYPAGFAGYEWMRMTYPDSANTMSAMVTGVRTYNGAINVDGAGKPVTSAPERAKAAGKAVGTVSSVPFVHATPAAGGGAHNVDRGATHEIAAEMLDTDTLDFIAGGGNPDYDSSGRRIEGEVDGRYRWVSPAQWQALKAGTSGWRLIEDRAAIRDLSNFGKPGERIALIPRVAAALQVERPGKAGADPRESARTAAPNDVPPLPGIPSLSELTLAALTHIGNDPEGFFLSVEGGAVDWAMHANSAGRMIEEYVDFDEAVATVVSWIDDSATPATWENTLVVVTADHDHLLFGPDETVPFQAVENRGPGQLPGHRWWSNSHSNQLVPFFARGAGAEQLLQQADEEDRAKSRDQIRGRGRYLTQPELGMFLVGLFED